MVTRRSEFRLKKARDRAHVVEGLLRALDMIDAIITLIRGSESADAARGALMAAPFEFTEVQAGYILDLQLRRLAALERQRLRDEYDELQNDDLASSKRSSPTNRSSAVSSRMSWSRFATSTATIAARRSPPIPASSPTSISSRTRSSSSCCRTAGT